MNKYYYCDLDVYGQRTGFVCSLELPEKYVHSVNGLSFCALSLVHSSGFVEYHTMLYKSESDCTRSALA